MEPSWNNFLFHSAAVSQFSSFCLAAADFFTAFQYQKRFKTKTFLAFAGVPDGPSSFNYQIYVIDLMGSFQSLFEIVFNFIFGALLPPLVRLHQIFTTQDWLAGDTLVTNKTFRKLIRRIDCSTSSEGKR